MKENRKNILMPVLFAGMMAFIADVFRNQLIAIPMMQYFRPWSLYQFVLARAVLSYRSGSDFCYESDRRKEK